VSVVSPLAGDDEDQLDADAGRIRGRRYEHGDRYDVAEHGARRVPEPGGGVNHELVTIW
jgi:hypothetical protein